MMLGIGGAAAAVLAIGAWQINDAAFDRGRDRTDAAWRKIDDANRAKAAALAAERDAAVRGADVAGALARRSVDALAARGRDTVRTFYRDNPGSNVACLSPDRVRAIADANARALAAATATP